MTRLRPVQRASIGAAEKATSGPSAVGVVQESEGEERVQSSVISLLPVRACVTLVTIEKRVILRIKWTYVPERKYLQVIGDRSCCPTGPAI